MSCLGAGWLPWQQKKVMGLVTKPASQGGAAYEQIISTKGLWVLAMPPGAGVCGSEGILGEPEPRQLPVWFSQLGAGCEVK